MTHHLIAEEKYNRHVDKDITVRFQDGNRQNLDPSNIVIKPKVTVKKEGSRKALLDRRIAELQAERDLID